MKDGGTAMMGLGESDTEKRASDAVEKAVLNPLLDVDITGAKGALINITGGADMTLKDAKIVMETVSEKLDPAAKVIWGSRIDTQLENWIRVMLIVTGLKPQAQILPGGDTAISASEQKTEMENKYGIDFVI
jgi:cell division protein FtsZ